MGKKRKYIPFLSPMEDYSSPEENYDNRPRAKKRKYEVYVHNYIFNSINIDII